MNHEGSADLLILSAFGQKTPARRHVNPDGSIGGLVPMDAIIPPGVVIHPLGLVAPGANLIRNQIVSAGEIALP